MVKWLSLTCYSCLDDIEFTVDVVTNIVTKLSNLSLTCQFILAVYFYNLITCPAASAAAAVYFIDALQQMKRALDVSSSIYIHRLKKLSMKYSAEQCMSRNKAGQCINVAVKAM